MAQKAAGFLRSMDYPACVPGALGDTGVALVEVYEVMGEPDITVPDGVLSLGNN
jgi:hypothetical protein